MTERLTVVPDPSFESLKGLLSERLTHLGDRITAEQFADLLDPLLCRVLHRGFSDAGAHEGTVWIVDSATESLVPAYNTGPNAAAMVGRFRQPLGAGLISMVFASEQPFIENDVARNTRQSKLLDSQLKVQTHALIAVPFQFLHTCRGVVSCVQLKKPSEPDPPGFRPDHLANVGEATALVARLLEYRLLSRTVGWACE